MHSSSKYRKLRYLYAIPCFFIFSSALLTLQLTFNKNPENSPFLQKSYISGSDGNSQFDRIGGDRKLLDIGNTSDLDCIPSGIHSFPEDFFTQEERQKGGVLVHFLILAYICAMIAIVCDVYFIPSLDIIADKLHLPPDVAGATFMAIGASSPELFSSIIGK
ncbi:hypothetical protein TNCT_544741 [Trichonephila clavata]|uniref:Sodium/calcium exchanger membrane region domain-containing protein n=1 Tax=Trichonephila clavata TaxID=2740835 RepID=A0A8X6F1G7_TRICU|nr:hypothetical protein TNCT_544741 [Trichonephila clavata]